MEDEAGIERKLAGEVGFVGSIGLVFSHIAAAALTLLGLLFGEVRGGEDKDEVCTAGLFSLPSNFVSSKGSSLSSSSSAAAISPAEGEDKGDGIVGSRSTAREPNSPAAVLSNWSYFD